MLPKAYECDEALIDHSNFNSFTLGISIEHFLHHHHNYDL